MRVEIGVAKDGSGVGGKNICFCLISIFYD